MCGISLVLHFHTQHPCKCLQRLQITEKTRLQLIQNRGPNSYSEHQSYLPEIDLVFHASVLHVRGSSVVVQPVVSCSTGNVLLWNGEIFDGISVEPGENDTLKLQASLNNCETEEDILNLFARIHGPCAFIFFHKPKRRVWFGRDILGRRSLLWHEKHVTESGCHFIKISSASDANDTWSTVPSTGIFCLNLNNSQDQSKILFPWTQNISGSDIKEDVLPFSVNRSSKILCPIRESLNVCDPNADTEYLELAELLCKIPTKDRELLFERLFQHQYFQEKVNTFLNVLGRSVKKRVNFQCFSCTSCRDISNCSHCSIAVLFSGGLDCTVLAILADKHLPSNIPIDLINVSFEHRVICSRQKSKKLNYISTFESPDRISAIESYKELKSLCPSRQWNLVEVNVIKDELNQVRNDRVQPVILPQQTVLDDSIGCALWFAARGCGQLKSGSEEYSDYTSPAKIVLLGMGADEQLGGYSRHRNQFHKEGWAGLIKEVQLEIDRISERNLARDDRIISDNGREARMPYLDEEVVSFLNHLPIWVKANPNLPRGIGEKILLRAAAYRLGLRFSALLPKRAIQFGSRIAKLETRNEKGNDICTRLQTINL